MNKLMHNVHVYDFEPTVSDFRDNVLSGLRRSPKQLQPKYFYDEEGSMLFEKITTLDEYYLTRTEMAILESNKSEIAGLISHGATLIELGSGNSDKVEILLNVLPEDMVYMPIDISRDFLQSSVEKLHAKRPELQIQMVCADYAKIEQLPVASETCKKVIFFPGSTIGNLEPDEVKQFMLKMSHLLQSGDGMIIGVDLVKSEEILHRAYNDAQGLTAAFNMNLLRRINKELNADFQLEKFAHIASYSKVKRRIEMYLESLEDQVVQINDQAISFKKHERIHTENSYKYTIDAFQHLAKENDFQPQHVWVDNDKLFSVHYLEK